MRAKLVIFGVALLVASCGSDEPAATTTPAQPTSTTTVHPTSTAAPATSTTGEATTTSGPATTTTTSSHVDVEIAGGEISGPETFELELGDTLDIWILSDVDDELHVHGYDIFYELDAGVPLNVSLVADVPGVFEAELEGAHLHLFEIEVTG